MLVNSGRSGSLVPLAHLTDAAVHVPVGRLSLRSIVRRLCRGLLDEDVLWARVKEPVPVLETVLAKRFVTSSQLARLQVEEHRCSLFLPLRGLEVVSELPHIA